MSSQVFYVSCFGSSLGPLLSPAPTAITIQDDFGSCPTFPTSDASWAFPGDGGQEIKFRAMLYIYVGTEGARILTSPWAAGVTFPLYIQLYLTQEKKMKQLQARKELSQLSPQLIQFLTNNLELLLN